MLGLCITCSLSHQTFTPRSLAELDKFSVNAVRTNHTSVQGTATVVALKQSPVCDKNIQIYILRLLRARDDN